MVEQRPELNWRPVDGGIIFDCPTCGEKVEMKVPEIDLNSSGPFASEGVCPKCGSRCEWEWTEAGE